MLRSLHIENYVLIDSLDVEFPEGLSIITGQTGAGKSILLGALSLLTGGKGDALLISEGASSCVVEGEFDVPGLDPAWFEENGVEQDGTFLTVRRVLGQSGRARAFVNDCPVNAQVLQDLSVHLVDIHGQHQSLRLADRRFQMEVLDAYAGCTALTQECRTMWADIRKKDRELSALRDELFRLEADREYNEAQFRQLDQANLREGELEELEAEQRQLANAESIKENFAALRALFEPSEAATVDLSLKEAERLMGRLSALVPGTEELSQRLHSARIELSDILSTANDMDNSVLLSQERLQQVEERMSLLYSLMQKHGCSSIGELVAVRDRYSGALFDAGSLEERISRLGRDLEALRRSHLALCARIHEGRLAAKDRFAEGICDSLRFLELDRAVFSVELERTEPGSTGCDAVFFGFSSVGGEAQDVAKCASGGEISRIMLCLKAVMARFGSMPTMIFDEIDTGVSGSAADRMGSMICSMGEHMQVIAITHLPQVAAKGSAHFVVEKAGTGSGVVSSMRRLDSEGRVAEIARLLSGSSVTPEAIANARILLNSPAR